MIFLALCEERSETPCGMDSYMISRDPARQDDFAHAVNFACCTIWHRYGWPDLALVGRSPHSDAPFVRKYTLNHGLGLLLPSACS